MAEGLTRRGYADGLRELAELRRGLDGAVRAGAMRLAEAEAALQRDRRLLAFVDHCAALYCAGLAAAEAAEAAGAGGNTGDHP